MNNREKCASFIGGYGCKKLKITTCEDDECVFFQTKAEAKVSKEKADKRLRSLPKIDQQYIAEKYHKGKVIWNKGGTRDDC